MTETEKDECTDIIKKTMEEAEDARCMGCGWQGYIEYSPQGMLHRDRNKPLTVHNFECSNCGMKCTLWNLEITDLDEYYDNLMRQKMEVLRRRIDQPQEGG